MSIHRVLLALLAALLCTGCVQIRESMQLAGDGSGTVHMTVVIPQLGLRWLPGKPIADWVRPNLPEGVRLSSFENTQAKTKVAGQDGKLHELVSEQYDLDLSFDRIEALNEIRVRPDVRNTRAAVAGGTPGKQAMAFEDSSGPDVGPFQRLTLTEEGDRLHFHRVIQAARDPAHVQADALNRPGSVAKPAAVDLGDSSLILSITCPGEVIEHNAGKVEGRTLTWVFKLKQLQQHQDRDWIVKFTCRREAKQ